MPKATGVTFSRQTIDVCRLAYETTATSFRKLELARGIPRSILHDVARRESWVKFERSPSDRLPGAREARDVETEILVNGLTVESPASGTMPADRRPRGRPKGISQYLTMRDAAPVTPEQQRLRWARDEYSAGAMTLRAIARKYRFSSGKLHYVARVEGWTRPPDTPVRGGSAGDAKLSPDRPAKPISAPKEKRGWSAVKAASDVRTADVINFPGALQDCPKNTESVRLTAQTSAGKAQLRVTLAAIRAAMSVEQVHVLEHHQALLAQYSHHLEVYLEPQRFVDTRGLGEAEAAERVVAVQKDALRTLLPTERDTLAGAIKVLTDAVGRTIQLQRAVAGLDKVASAALRPGDPNNPSGDEDGMKGQIIDLEALGTADLRAVQHGMEILDRHHRKQQDAPKPPPPEPIDDLLELVPVVGLEDEEIPPR
jgi:hypothetical protein